MRTVLLVHITVSSLCIKLFPRLHLLSVTFIAEVELQCTCVLVTTPIIQPAQIEEIN